MEMLSRTVYRHGDLDAYKESDNSKMMGNMSGFNCDMNYGDPKKKVSFMSGHEEIDVIYQPQLL